MLKDSHNKRLIEMLNGSDQFNVQKFTQRRFKRDNLLATENGNDDDDEEPIPAKRTFKVRRRKISKKVTEPEIQSTMEDLSQTISVNPTRRRILITKSRRLNTEVQQSTGDLLMTSISPDYVKTDAETQQEPKRLRKVTITKRKLLKPTAIQTTLDTIVPTSTYQSIDVPLRNDKDDDENDRSAVEENKLSSKSKKKNVTVTPSSTIPIPNTPSHLVYTTTTEYYDTITKTTTRLRTFTYVVTRVHDHESQIMSTTTVREQTKPVTETLTRTSTYTLQIPIVVIPTTVDQSNSYVQQTAFNHNMPHTT